MPAVFAFLAGAVVLAHLSFVVFVTAGALLVLRWRAISWVHVPAVAWAAYIELSGGICPLTPLEMSLRARAGLDYYSGDFVARYLFPMLYPEGLTREAQMAVGIAVLIVNVVMYGWVAHHRRGARS